MEEEGQQWVSQVVKAIVSSQGKAPFYIGDNAYMPFAIRGNRLEGIG
jgi:hypothetical protein